MNKFAYKRTVFFFFLERMKRNVRDRADATRQRESKMKLYAVACNPILQTVAIRNKKKRDKDSADEKERLLSQMMTRLFSGLHCRRCQDNRFLYYQLRRSAVQWHFNKFQRHWSSLWEIGAETLFKDVPILPEKIKAFHGWRRTRI